MSRANAQWVLDNAKGDMLPRDLYERARWLAHDHIIALGNLEEAQRDLQLQNRRAEFAKHAMTGLLTNADNREASVIAGEAVRLGDALIRELQRTGPNAPSFDELLALFKKAEFIARGRRP